MAQTATSSPSGLSGAAPAAARKGFKLIARKVQQSGPRAIRVVAERTAAAGRGPLEASVDASLSRRLPVEVSIDVAVPVGVAWDEWMCSSTLSEGAHRIDDVQRDGECLIGKIAGARGGEWAAEIVDERPEQSFGWKSVEGSDCAGLVTFRRLSDRLTRIELDLDVLPTSPTEALMLSLHLAHRRAEASCAAARHVSSSLTLTCTRTA